MITSSPRPKRVFVIGLVLAVIAVAIGIGLLIYFNTSSKQALTTPDYQTVLPKGKSIEELGGWQQVSPPGSDPVFAFADTVDGVSVSVSQQPLPESFKTDIEGRVAELAKKFNATTQLEADDMTVYVGTSAKGPQSVIFTKKGLLVLIKSQQKIQDSAWTAYISSLN